jgi:hypothetical protein
MNAHIAPFYDILLICRPSDPIEFAARFFEDERVSKISHNNGSQNSGPNVAGGVVAQTPPPAMILHAMQALPYVINEDTWFIDFSCKLFLFLTDAERSITGPRAIKLNDASAFVESLASKGYAPPLPAEIRRRLNGSISTDLLSLSDFTNYLRISLRAALLCHIFSTLFGAALRYSDASNSSTSLSRNDDVWSIDARVLQSLLPHPCIAPHLNMFSDTLNLATKSTDRDGADRGKEACAALSAVLGRCSNKGPVSVEEIVLGLLMP